MAKSAEPKKIVLAYSGGLDTSVILPWLKQRYPGVKLVAFAAELGQGDELKGIEKKAKQSGADEVVVKDLRKEFAEQYCFPLLRAHATYETDYLLGTSIARPLIAKHQVMVAHDTKADAVGHGATGKGNDQVRFELTYMALDPKLKIISPWKDQQVIDDGHGHHIQRLMVTGNFALIAGVHPRAISDWYLGMYVDGVDWATLPNTLGMSQHADGGVVGTKPYAASGAYINRMSNYCKDCQYDVQSRTGQGACPFNTLYWHFLIRNRDRLASNQRMALVMKNLESMNQDEQVTITREGDALRRRFGVTSS